MDKGKYIEKQDTSSSEDKPSSSRDFATGWTKKKVTFSENHQEGHPMSKYRDHKDVEIVNKRNKSDIIRNYQSDFKSIYDDIEKLYKELEGSIEKSILKEKIPFTMEDCNKVFNKCNKVFNILWTRSSTEKTLSEHADSLVDMLIYLNEFKANPTRYCDDGSSDDTPPS